ncbi:MAG: squalene/phytoene synthase family protein [Alphaproteobacteria bacterium]|nr:squalene/phytoene synthase family protein [Alphaproteobacteria bacterium]
MVTPGHLTYCKKRVRQFDQDRYLTALFAPEESRQGLYALYAFNLEIAQIPEIAREPLVGEIRLEWWRETIAAAYEGTPPEHAVAACLAETIRTHGLTRSCFDRLLDARSFDQERRPPASADELKIYAEATSSNLVRLALEVLGVPKNAATEKAALAIGVAWALVGLLRAVPFHGRDERLYLPRDLMETAGVSVRQIRSGKSTPALEGLVHSLADEARACLRAARQVAAEVPATARPALLLGALADGHLGVLEKAGYNPFDPRVQKPPPFRELRLWLRARRGKY